MLDHRDPNCVPYDIFSGTRVAGIGQLSERLRRDRGPHVRADRHVDFTGTLGEYGVQTPWAEDGVGVNVGAEYRKEKLTLNPDQSFQTGDLTGQGAPTLPVDGDFDVKEFFAEAQIPIVQNNFIHDLTLSRRLPQVVVRA